MYCVGFFFIDIKGNINFYEVLYLVFLVGNYLNVVSCNINIFVDYFMVDFFVLKVKFLFIKCFYIYFGELILF